MIVECTRSNRKLVYVSLILLFALAVVCFIMAYTFIAFIAFPHDTNEEQCGILTNETTKIILCRRNGDATVAFYYVLYENEINPDNVVAIIRDAGIMPKLETSGDGYPIIRISDMNDIVYLVKTALVDDLCQRGALIKLKVK